MKKRVYEIKVTRKDIQNGNPQDENFCPIALAAKRKFHRPVEVVGDMKILTDSGTRFLDLPRPALTFITRFDDGKSVKPFTFKAVEYLYD